MEGVAEGSFGEGDQVNSGVDRAMPYLRLLFKDGCGIDLGQVNCLP